jgi:class 3 adenylate cyclase/tetratricopeptide (TPR) repeat protein
MRCPSCGENNPERAKFCLNCATPLSGDPEAPREVRKTVTIVFSDVTGSTAIGERLDPETVRRVMERYFEAMKAEIERHGGTVEKFIGDAVMAVFGIPRAHEDDALRAVRAAVGMRVARVSLNEELRTGAGVQIVSRTGVNTGEVVANVSPGQQQRLVTGDTVNVAARLEQVAPPGEILLGGQTYRLIRDAVRVEELEPLELKGKSERVPAWRLVSLEEGGATARRSEAPFVGRNRERRVIADVYERTVAERSCSLFTLLGTAGVGKSRLVAEVLGSLEPSPLVRSGRCLPYGDGITFWPIVEIAKQGARIEESDDPAEVRRKIAGTVQRADEAEAIELHLSALLGLVPAAGAIEETNWAIRRFLETLTDEGSLVVVFDDLHWAEPALLDAIEHVADLSRDAPILLLCLARPEFLDGRPGWGGGKFNASSLLLEPLGEGDGEALVRELLGAELGDEVAEQIVRTAEGNPLFVEELLAMLLEDGVLREEGGVIRQVKPLQEIELPSSIQLLLAARLDRLEPPELSIVEGAAVVGQVFYRGAVAALSPEGLRPDVATYLQALVRKDLVRPERGGFPGEQSYRFRHILLRDAAYRAMPKQVRAELHERFAEWLEEIAGERLAEYEEIVAYHLEQAWRLRTELHADDETSSRLADRAGRALTSCGGRAYSRRDMRAAANLLGRAAAMLSPHDATRLHILPQLAESLAETGDSERGLRLLEDALAGAPHGIDEATLTRLRLARIESWDADDASIDWSATAEHEATRAITIFGAAGDALGQAQALRMLAFVAWGTGRVSDAQGSWHDAAELCARAGDRSSGAIDLGWIVTADLFGPRPVPDALRSALETLAIVKDIPSAAAWIKSHVAVMYAMLGRFTDAGREREEAIRIEHDLGRGLTVSHYGTQFDEFIYRLGGNTEARIQVLRDGQSAYQDLVHKANPMLAALLSNALVVVGRDDEAWQQAELARDIAPEHPHILPLILQAEAIVLARRGDAEGEARARQAVDLFATTEFLWPTADAWISLARALRLAAKTEQAAGAARDALRLYEAKRILPLVREAEIVLEEIEVRGND